jgi:hypothetical protein
MPRKPAAPSGRRSQKRSKKRAQRPRPVPRWLTGNKDLDQVAQRRCLMVLSVLSGERPVTSVVEELGISRGFYYQLETKALLSMLRALAPGAEGATTSEAATQSARIAELEAKVAKLEQEKRRAERLLYLARKVLPPGPVTTPGRGRPRRKASSSTSAGSERSPSSPSSTTPASRPATASIPTPDGEGTP